MNQSNFETRVLFSQRQSLVVLNGILYREFVNEKGDVLCFQVVVPYELRRRYLENVHGSRLNGHSGFAKSRLRLQKLAYWPGANRDLRLYVKCCRKCNGSRKTLNNRHAPLKYANTTGCFHRIHIENQRCKFCDSVNTQASVFCVQY